MSTQPKKQSDSEYQASKNVFAIPIRVYYQDTDAGGVVYHSTHLDFLERARYEWLRDLGFDVQSLTDIHKVHFMVRSLEIEYFKPALLDNLLNVTVQLVEMGRSRIALSHQTFFDQTLLARATVHVVCVGTESLKPVSVPIPLRHKLGNLS
tara:strand:- start:250 stop:702 length:453 start_codon:yes stop_codon:yes gene_type:complete